VEKPTVFKKGTGRVFAFKRKNIITSGRMRGKDGPKREKVRTGIRNVNKEAKDFTAGSLF